MTTFTGSNTGWPPIPLLAPSGAHIFQQTYSGDQLLVDPKQLEAWTRNIVSYMNQLSGQIAQLQADKIWTAEFQTWVRDHHPELLAAYTNHTEMKAKFKAAAGDSQ